MNAEWLSVVVIALLAALAWWMLPRQRTAANARAQGRPRYRAQPLIASELMPMLSYLHTVFPGQTVLTRVPLTQLLAPATQPAPASAQAALQGHAVDYVVCDHQGLPQFAFDVERYHLSKVEEHDAELKQKNRMLHSAGIRLVFLRQQVDRMPRPADMRRQLDLADLREAGPHRAAASHNQRALNQLKQLLDAEDSRYQSTKFRESEVVMGMSRLMDLGKADTPGESSTDPAPLQPKRPTTQRRL